MDNGALLYILEFKRSDIPTDQFGIPEERKYPLDTEAHVLSAIKFFNYVSDKYEEELARNIIKKIKEYNMEDKVHVGEKNRFSKYWKENVKESCMNTDKIIEDLGPVGNAQNPALGYSSNEVTPEGNLKDKYIKEATSYCHGKPNSIISFESKIF